MKSTSKAVKKLTRSYQIALGLIAILLIGGQVVVQVFLKGQREDAKILNLAGQQRMLSQQLGKTVLLIRQSTHEEERTTLLKYFQDSFQQFLLTQQNLMGYDNTLINKINNPPHIQALYEQQKIYYDNMIAGGRQIMLSTTQEDSTHRHTSVTEGTRLILKNEGRFLLLMGQIADAYAEESREDVSYLSIIEGSILIVALIVLGIDLLVIFEPLTKYLIENDETKELNAKLKKANEGLEEQKTKLIKNQRFIEQVRKVTEEKNKELEEQTKLMFRQHEKIEKSTKKLNESIRYAERIQKAMFVRRKKIRDAFIDNFIVFRPRDIVSGDFYWFKERDGRKLMAVVDCTGHGVPGAFMSLIGMDLMAHICSGKPQIEPSTILEELHYGIFRLLKQGQSKNRDGMDASICIYDTKRQRLEFAGAKQHLYYFRKLDEDSHEIQIIKGSVFPIGGGKLPPAKEAKRSYPISILDANKVYAFYLMSDGYIDQFGQETGRKFLITHFKTKLTEIYQLPMRQQQRILERTFEEWKGETAQTDDVLVVGVKV